MSDVPSFGSELVDDSLTECHSNFLSWRHHPIILIDTSTLILKSKKEIIPINFLVINWKSTDSAKIGVVRSWCTQKWKIVDTQNLNSPLQWTENVEENFESICVNFMFRGLFPRMDIQLSPEIAIRLYYYYYIIIWRYLITTSVGQKRDKKTRKMSLVFCIKVVWLFLFVCLFVCINSFTLFVWRLDCLFYRFLDDDTVFRVFFFYFSWS